MPLQGGTKEYNTFVKGIVTEASALSFPENASKDEDNFQLYRDGSRQRRLGCDYESLHVKLDTGLTSSVMSTASIREFRWDSPDNNPALSVGVIQVYNQLWFVDMQKTTFSTNVLNGGVALTIPGLSSDPVQFDSVNGVLVCANKNVDPFYITYNQSNNTVTSTSITLKTRDFWGVADNLVVDERPSSLTPEHEYNLYNQGWLSANIVAFKADTGSVHPSNADIQYLGKDSDDVFDAALLKKQFFGTSDAAKGKFIVDVFSRGVSRNTLSGLTTALDTETGRPSTVSSYAGRIFYAGINSNISAPTSRSPKLSGTIFFSKIITINDDFDRCYQEADPTSEHVSDIIDSDGGFINIPEASNILKIVATERRLVVIAENGVWEIYGDVGGFSATSYQVSKVTDIGCISPRSVVYAEGSLLYWAQGGIYSLDVDKDSDRLVSTNLIETTIQTLYNSIPGTAQLYATGAFDPASRKITWLYNDSSTFNGTTYTYKANRVLVLDVALKAFHTRTFQELVTDGPYVVGTLISQNFISADYTDSVVVNGELITADSVEVQATTSGIATRASSTKHVVIKPSSTGNFHLTFAEYNNTNFLDWFTDDTIGLDAAAYMETGQELFGDTQRLKQVPYITFHLNRTETGFTASGTDLLPINTSSCLVQARWDFSNHINSGKFGTAFQVYRLKRPYQPQDVNDNFDYGQSVITTKSKLRGRGRALALRITTEAGKDCHLLGWGLQYNMGSLV